MSGKRLLAAAFCACVIVGFGWVAARAQEEQPAEAPPADAAPADAGAADAAEAKPAHVVVVKLKAGAAAGDLSRTLKIVTDQGGDGGTAELPVKASVVMPKSE